MKNDLSSIMYFSITGVPNEKQLLADIFTLLSNIVKIMTFVEKKLSKTTFGHKMKLNFQ